MGFSTSCSDSKTCRHEIIFSQGCYSVFLHKHLVGINDNIDLRTLMHMRGGGRESFFCTVQMEDSTHRFVQCPIVSQIWSYISQIWQVLLYCYFSLRQWVFAQVDLKSMMAIVFYFREIEDLTCFV